MAITSLDDYIAGTKQIIEYTRTGGRTTIAFQWFSLMDLTGQPGAGVLAGTNTANGIVPTDATAGYPSINSFGGTEGYISRIDFANTVASRIQIFDRVFLAGAYAFNANTTLASQPSFADRLPNTDYKALEIWVEQVTAATGNQAVNVTYTDQDGNTGATTGAVGIGAAPTLGRCWQLPLAAGDSGVQAITNVTGSVASAGTFNVMLLRPLWSGRILFNNYGDIHNMLTTGLPRIYDTSALYVLIAPDATVSGVPSMSIEIVNG